MPFWDKIKKCIALWVRGMDIWAILAPKFFTLAIKNYFVFCTKKKNQKNMWLRFLFAVGKVSLKKKNVGKKYLINKSKVKITFMGQNVLQRKL